MYGKNRVAFCRLIMVAGNAASAATTRTKIGAAVSIGAARGVNGVVAVMVRSALVSAPPHAPVMYNAKLSMTPIVIENMVRYVSSGIRRHSSIVMVNPIGA